MSPRGPSRPPPPDPAPAEAPRAPAGDGSLLRKYRELLTKHEVLVHRLEERNAEHISIFRLSSWAMERSSSALALLGKGAALTGNPRWHALARTGPWYRLEQGRPVGPPYRTLRDLADVEAQLVLALDSPRTGRFRLENGALTLEVRIEPLARGRERRALVLAHDITEQVRGEAELERAREALVQREQLHSLGEMASGIAHDLNNTLSAMRLRLELLMGDPEFALRHQAHLDALARIVSDAGMRVRRLQDFARQRPERTGERVRLADVVREAVDIARGEIEGRAAREGLRLAIDVDMPALPEVEGSATELRYVFINLLLNARDAMPRGGTLHVKGAHEGGRVIVMVEDEGTGIPEEHLKDVFRPFFTTKGERGTGLGLSMAYGVVSRAGGTLTAANRPEGGAVFTLSFPALTPPRAPPSRPPRPKRARRKAKGP